MREATRRVRWVDPKSDHAPNRDIVGAHGRPALAPWASVRPYTSPTGFRVRGDSDSRFRSARARRPSETRPHASRKKIAADATNRHAIWARRPKVPGDLPGAPTPLRALWGMSRAGSCYRASVCRGEACFAPTHFTRSRVLPMELSDTLTQVSRLPEPVRAPSACSSRRGGSPAGDSNCAYRARR